MSVILDYEKVMGIIVGTLERSDWIYENFDEDGMVNTMAFNLQDVLGRLECTEGPGGVYVKDMKVRMDDTFIRVNWSSEKFDWADVRYILGDFWDNGAIECFITILYGESESLIMHELFARLVVCCFFCK